MHVDDSHQRADNLRMRHSKDKLVAPCGALDQFETGVRHLKAVAKRVSRKVDVLFFLVGVLFVEFVVCFCFLATKTAE
jgi:hypothetical protein